MSLLRNQSRRTGVASMWSLTVLSIVGLISAGVMREIVLNRYASEMRDNRLRAERLACSGVELAIDKILDDENYKGETARFASGDEVHIDVAKTNAGLRIEVEAKYLFDCKSHADAKIVREVQRTENDGRVEVKVLEKSKTRDE